MGDTAQARKRRAKLREMGASPIRMAYVHAALGDTERTLAAFEAVEDWPYVATVTLRYLNFPDAMAGLRGTSRYEALIESVNRAWGLTPDGGLPEPPNTPPELRADG